MSEERKQSLVITAYKGRDTANEVYKVLRQLEKDKKLDMKTAMVIYRKKNGKLKLVHKRRANTWGGTAIGGGVALLLGAATGGALLAGAVIGGAIGGFGHTKRTETKRFLEDKLGPDDSAIAVLVIDADWEAAEEATKAYDGEDLVVELTDQAAMQMAALAADDEVSAAVAEEVEVEEEAEA
jgi:uncharacterized membrane protein